MPQPDIRVLIADDHPVVRDGLTLALPQFVLGTDRLAMVQRGVGWFIEQFKGVVLLEPPFEATPISNALWWHPVHRSDPAHAWMRGVFVRAGEILSSEVGGRDRA